MLELNLADLLQEPFGPYADAQILDRAFPHNGLTPRLEQFWMTCAGDPVGFVVIPFMPPCPLIELIAVLMTQSTLTNARPPVQLQRKPFISLAASKSRT